MQFKRANILKAVFFLIFSFRRYLSIALQHNMAINLEAPDLLKCYEKGTFTFENWQIDALPYIKDSALAIKKGLWNSFFIIFLCLILALAMGYINGVIHPEFEIDFGITTSFAGTFLASWATLMALHGGYKSWEGQTIHELLMPVLFKLIFVPGIFFLFLGSLISTMH